MKTYDVEVQKYMYAIGTVRVEAEDEQAARDQTEARILAGKLQTTAVKWDDPEYEDCSFETTGEVNESATETEGAIT